MSVPSATEGVCCFGMVRCIMLPGYFPHPAMQTNSPSIFHVEAKIAIVLSDLMLALIAFSRSPVLDSSCHTGTLSTTHRSLSALRQARAPCWNQRQKPYLERWIKMVGK